MVQDIGYITAFLAGIISFFSPCVVPLIPIFLTYISGADIKEVKGGGLFQPKVFKHTVFFVMGFSAIFILLGVLIGLLSQSIPMFQVYLAKVGGVVIIALGLQVMGLIDIPFLSTEYKLDKEVKEPSYVGSLIIGGAFAIGWTPCTSPVLAGILVLAGGMASVTYGATLLTLYSAGFAIPFLLAGLFLGKFAIVIKKMDRYLGFVNVVAGLFLVVLGILIYTQTIQRYLSQILL